MINIINDIKDLDEFITKSTFIRYFLNTNDIFNIVKLVQFYNNKVELIGEIYVGNWEIQKELDYVYSYRYNLLINGAFNTFKDLETLMEFRDTYKDYVRLVGPFAVNRHMWVGYKKVNLYIKISHNYNHGFQKIVWELNRKGTPLDKYSGIRIPIEFPCLDFNNLDDLMFRFQLRVRDKLLTNDGKFIDFDLYKGVMESINNLYYYEHSPSRDKPKGGLEVIRNTVTCNLVIKFTNGKTSSQSYMVTDSIS